MSEMGLSKQKLKYHFIFMGTIVTALLIRMLFYMGPSGADDMIYFSVVENLLQNEDVGTVISSSKHWGVRLGLILPVWMFMKVFGVSQFSAYLFPLIMSMGTMILIYIIGIKLFNPAIALISAAFLALLPQDIYLSTVIYPDGPVVLFSVLFIYMFYKLSDKDRLAVRHAILAGFVLGIAYFIRETALILLITIPILFFHAKNKKNFIKTAVFIIIGLLVAIVIEMIVFWYLTGDPLTRWEILLGETKVLEPRKFTVYSHTKVGSGSMMHKYLLEPFFVIFATHWISPLMISVVAGIFLVQIYRKQNHNFYSLKKGHFLWLFILTFGILAFYSYGPVYGLTVPLERNIRYYHTITPLASLLTGVIIYELMDQKGSSKFIGSLIILFYILSSSICMASIINKNVHGLVLIEEFISQNPADNYIMPEMLKKTLEFKKVPDIPEYKIITYKYEKRIKMEQHINDLITNVRKVSSVQYVFIIPNIHIIQKKFRRPIEWPMERMVPVTVMTTSPGRACGALRSSDMIFNMIPDFVKSKICYTTDVYVYQLK